MKKLLLLCGVVAVAAIGAGLSLGAKPPPPPPPVPPPPYILRVLNNNLGGAGSSLSQLNDLGDAIGIAETATGSTNIVTTPESRAAGIDMVDLRQLLIDGGFCDPTPGARSGWFISSVAGINNSRQIAAKLTLAQDDHSIGQRPAYMQLSVTPDGAVSITSVTDLSSPLTNAYEPNVGVAAVNNQGDILGHAWVPDPNSTAATVAHLILYSPELGWTDLGTIDPGVNAFGNDLSDRDGSASVYIVGDGNWRLRYNIPTSAAASVVRLQGTYSRDPAAWTYGVNAAGKVAGEMNTGRSDSRAFLYDGTMKNLGNLTSASSWNNSWANAVNASGITVGGSMTGSAPGNTGLIYVSSTGKTFDMANCLNAADKAAYSALADRNLDDINASGMICGPNEGVVFSLSVKRAYLLSPASP